MILRENVQFVLECKRRLQPLPAWPTIEAKAGAFAYTVGGKGWSLRLRGKRQRLEPSLTRQEQRLEPSLTRQEQRLEPSLTRKGRAPRDPASHLQWRWKWSFPIAFVVRPL